MLFTVQNTFNSPNNFSGVGIIGYALVFVSAPLDLLGIIDTTGTGSVLYVPYALFELLLLPIWLFVKGFNHAAVRS